MYSRVGHMTVNDPAHSQLFPFHIFKDHSLTSKFADQETRFSISQKCKLMNRNDTGFRREARKASLTLAQVGCYEILNRSTYFSTTSIGGAILYSAITRSVSFTCTRGMSYCHKWVDELIYLG